MQIQEQFDVLLDGELPAFNRLLEERNVAQIMLP
jgi:hypothetical protein